MFSNDVIKQYINSRTSPQTILDSKFVEVKNLVVGKLGITAIAENIYKVNIVLYNGQIHSSTCTCDFEKTQNCKHVVAVLKVANDLLIQETGVHSQSNSDYEVIIHPSMYTFLNFSFKNFSNSFIFEHQRDTASNSYRTSSIHKIDYGYAEIYVSRSFYDRVKVDITYNNDDLILECHCKTSKKYLCEHQEQVMYLLKDDPTVRLFFDQDMRLNYLQRKVGDYGLEKETNLDDYFKLKLEYDSVVIIPQIKGLISMGTAAKSKMEDSLRVTTHIPVEFTLNEQLAGKTFVVFGQGKYDEDFFVNFMSSNLTKEGKIKNPIKLVDARKALLQSEDPQEMKFFIGISQFQILEFYGSTKLLEEEEIAALRSIVKNPQECEIYCLNLKISENITSSSIVQVKLKKVDVDLHLKVVQKDNFFEITPKIFIDGSIVAYSKLKLMYKYFLRKENELLFVPDIDILRVLRFLKKHTNKLLIHKSKFDDFRETFLMNLEKKISIEYTYLKPANQKQLLEYGFDKESEKVLYLSESEDYVLLTPVMRYGNVEVPIRTKKRIYGLDVLGEAFEVERDESEEIRFLLAIQRQHESFSEQEGFDYFYLHKKHFLDEGWFLNAFETWKDHKVEILGFNSLKNNNLSPSKMSVAIAVSSGIDWFDTAVKVKFGEQDVRLKDIQRSLHNQSRFVKLGDGRLGMMPEEWMEKFSKFFRTGDIQEGLIRTPKIHFSVIDDLFENEVLSQEVVEEISMYRQKLAEFDQISTVKVPKKLKAQLRDYQKHGLNWLNFLDEFNYGGCLADDMGLGKTIQILAFILSLKEKNGRRTHLIVLPTSLLFNWRMELEKFAPSLSYHTIYGIDRQKDHSGLEKFDLVFTTYGTLLSDITFLKNFHFDYIFLDESQAIKNPDSKRYKSVRLLQSRNKIVLTGTPIENNTFDLYAQFSFVNPGLLGNQQQFRDNYSIPIDKFKDGYRAKELQQKLNPYLLRRTKKQVATELPEKTEMVIFCEMGKEQRKVYDSYKNEFKLYLEKSDKEELLNKNMHILQGLTKLRQICNSPALLSDEEYYGSESAKIDELIAQIELKSTEHKILIFSQFVTMLDLIKTELDSRSIPYEYLTGKTKDREARVKNFQEDDKTRVFLISLKAGGIGLNLTEADYVFIVDPWWNPAVENQAIDRCYRIGQKKNVMAIRLICPGTIEEKILLLQEGKKELINDLIKVDAHAVKSLSKDDLLQLLE
jgi:hypothetical protein